MLDYASLAAVTAVVREGSFDRAAALLGVTPSAVSQRVRALEERMGAILVVRGQPCTATAIGAQLCSHVERVRVLESDVLEALPGLGTLGPEGTPTVRVAVNMDSLTTWLPPALAAFANSAGVSIELVLEDEDHTAERLRSGDVLAAVTAEPSPVPGCRTASLGALRYVATASPAYAERHFTGGVTAESLARAPFLRFDRRDGLQARWARQALGAELHGTTHWVASTQGFLDLTLAGLGWSMNPLMLAEAHLRAGRLVELVPDTPLDVTLHWQASRVGSRLLDELTRAVKAAAREALRPLG